MVPSLTLGLLFLCSRHAGHPRTKSRIWKYIPEKKVNHVLYCNDHHNGCYINETNHITQAVFLTIGFFNRKTRPVFIQRSSTLYSINLTYVAI